MKGIRKFCFSLGLVICIAAIIIDVFKIVLGTFQLIDVGLMISSIVGMFATISLIRDTED